MSAVGARLAELGERLNPVLVRDVRQALRGRFFLFVSVLTLLASMLAVISVLTVGQRGGREGEVLFEVCGACLGIVAVMLVPLGAFQSLATEHEERTRDLLVLSNLTPGQIIRGKFLSFFLLTLLFAIELGPFLALCTLLRGVDPGEIGLSVLTILVRSAGYTLVALCLSSLAPNRSMRVLLLILMVLVVFMGDIVMMPLRFAMRGGPMIRGSGSELLPVALFVLLVGSTAYTLACGRFTHPEENRSTPMRIQLVLVAIALNVTFLVFPNLTRGSLSVVGTVRHVPDSIFFLTLAVLTAAVLVFAGEPSRLGRRVRAHLPRRRGLLLLAWPFLPGGGAGVAWYLATSLGYLAFVFATEAVFGRVGGSAARYGGGLAIVAVTLAYCALPPAVLPILTRKPTRRIALAAGTLIVAIVGTMVVEISLEGFYSGGSGSALRALSPFGLVAKVADRGVRGHETALAIVGGLALLSLLLNTVRGVRELRAALSEVRTRSAS